MQYLELIKSYNILIKYLNHPGDISIISYVHKFFN
jgi:hypothetical protein